MGPTRVGTSTGDITAGLFAAIGILAALAARERSGRGSRVDVSMLDAQVATLENAIVRFLASGEVPGPLGTRHPSIAPFQALATRDGFIAVAAGNDALFAKLCRAVGRPELAQEPDFASNELRTRHVEALARQLEQALAAHGSARWLERLEAAGIPCGPVNDIAQVVADPQVAARNMLVAVEGVALRVAGNPDQALGVPGSGAARGRARARRGPRADPGGARAVRRRSRLTRPPGFLEHRDQPGPRAGARLLFLHEIHEVVGAHEDAFEAAYRSVWLPALAQDADARLLYFLHHAHGSGPSYQVVTLTAIRDGAAWERLARRVAERRSRPRWTRELDDLRHDVTAKLLVTLPWSPLREIDFDGVPVDAAEHEPSLFMEDTVWPFEGRLEEYVLRVRLALRGGDDTRGRRRPCAAARRGELPAGFREPPAA